MEKKLRVGILGATGMVGQNYILLLENHPLFEVVYVAASSNSAGKSYITAVEGKWQMSKVIPANVRNLIVNDANNVSDAKGKVDFVFSALEMDKEVTKALELEYAKNDIPVVSNASAHRWTEDVPMLIPEINSDHVSVIDEQKKLRGFNKGFVVVKPNCSLQSYLTPVYALIKAGYEVKK